MGCDSVLLSLRNAHNEAQGFVGGDHIGILYSHVPKLGTPGRKLGVSYKMFFVQFMHIDSLL